jgi:hypothetical protein
MSEILVFSTMLKSAVLETLESAVGEWLPKLKLLELQQVLGSL